MSVPDPQPPRIGLWVRIKLRGQTLWQLYRSMRRGPFWWMTPFLLVLLMFALLFLIAESFPAAAPFVYALF